MVLRNPLLRAIACCASTIRLFSSVVDSVYILYATRSLGFQPAVVGIILGVGAFGVLLGALLTRRIVKWLGLGPTIRRLKLAVLGYLCNYIIKINLYGIYINLPYLMNKSSSRIAKLSNSVAVLMSEISTLVVASYEE